jgi:hypothetical protein
MRQALHIFCKDVRFLRIEIGILLLVNAAFPWIKLHLLHDDWSDALLALAAAYVVARVIHADAIPGDRQFWLTRPYHRLSLIGAKLLFVFVCVTLPIGLAQLAVVLAAGFPLRSAITALLWAQTLFFAVGAIPVVALAAVTSSIIPFIITALILALVATGAPGAFVFWFSRHNGTIPEAVDWVRNSVAGTAILVVSVLVLFWQYRYRATGFSRVLAIVVLNTAGMIFLFMPGSVPLTAQAWLSKKPTLASSVTVSLTRSPGGAVLIGRSPNENMRIPFTIIAADLPKDMEIRADAVSMSLEWPGRTWQPATMSGANRRSENETAAIFDLTLLMDPALFRAKETAPLTVRGSIFLTLFGEEERRTVSLRNRSVNVQDGIQCRSDQLTERADALICRSLFRWPARLVYAQSGGEQTDFSNTRISYSPFPAEMRLDPLEVRWGDPMKADEVTIVTKKPLVHFRREFEMRDVRLADFDNARTMPPAGK